MKYNDLGLTGLRVSQLGFGCGGMGGLLIHGAYPDMRRTVARAIELGINYFDTAAYYGAGQSEVNLGAVLRELGAEVIVGSKVRPMGEEMEDVGGAVVRSVEASLQRLGRGYIDLIQLHNRLGPQRDVKRDVLAVADLDAVKNAFTTLQRQGKVRHWGLGGLGTTDALRQAVASGGFESMQMVFNLMNPSAGMPVQAGFRFQDFGQIIDVAAGQGMGVIAFRILAGGALSGTVERHPVAAPRVDPIATETDYAADVARAQRYYSLVQEGYAASLVDAAIRFGISKQAVSTAILGISSLEQLEQAVASVERGPLPEAALERIQRMTGEA